MLRLTPLLARSVGFFPVFFPPERGFVHCPVHAQPAPVEAALHVVFQQTHLPQLGEHARLDPFLKAVVGRRSRAESGGVQGLPLTAGSQHKEDRVQADTIGNAWPTPAKPMRVGMGGNVDFEQRPEVVGDAPTVVAWGTIHGKPPCQI